MAIIFHEDWSLGNFSRWNCVATPPTPYRILNGIGADGGNVFTCSYTNNSVSDASLDTQIADRDTPYIGGAIRTQFALYSEPGPTVAWEPGFTIAGAANYICGTSTSDQFNAQLYLSNGQLILTFALNNPSATFATGYFPPTDGSFHGYQLTMTFPFTYQCDYNVVVDNVTVLSGTYTTPPTGPLGCVVWRRWGRFTGTCDPHVICDPSCFTPLAGISYLHCGVYRYPRVCNQYAVILAGNADFIFDSSDAIVSYPACNAPDLYPTLCYTPCTIGPLLCGADPGTIVVTGTEFSSRTSLTVYVAPFGVVAFDVISITSTAITIGNIRTATTPSTPIPFDSTFCISGVNLCP